jgi:hypothetical protein
VRLWRSALLSRRSSHGIPTAGEITIVRLGVIDGDPGVRPSARQFVAAAAAWETIPDDGLSRFAERVPL